MTLESLARTIAKARHGTDAMWANYVGAAEAVAVVAKADRYLMAKAYSETQVARAKAYNELRLHFDVDDTPDFEGKVAAYREAFIERAPVVEFGRSWMVDGITVKDSKEADVEFGALLAQPDGAQ